MGPQREVTIRTTAIVDTTENLWQQLIEMDDAHTAFTLLRKCLGTSRINHLLRTIPPTAARLAARAFDARDKDTIQQLMGRELPQATFQELTLPVRPLKNDIPTFGLGLYTAADTAPAAYLSSLSLTNDLRQNMCNMTIYLSATTAP